MGWLTSYVSRRTWFVLHDTTMRALTDYARLRDRLCPDPKCDAFLVSTRGTRLRKTCIHHMFARLLGIAGLTPRSSGGRPRLHDFRHGFAVQTLLEWYRDSLDVHWVPERRWHRVLLAAVTAARRVTVRLPHRILHALCYPLGAALLVAFVAPYRGLRRRARGRGLAAALPLKTYADYPFSVLVNDQFDRFSAPLERRYGADEVRQALEDAGLESVTVLPNHGWIGDGRRTGQSDS